MRPIVAQLCLLGALTSPWACMETNHDLLAARTDKGGSAGKEAGAGGMEAAAPDSPGEDSASALDSTPAEDAADAQEEPAVTPDGPSAFTIVNGISDAPAVRLCFDAGAGGTLSPRNVPPLPDDPAGLAYARSLHGTELQGIDLASEDIRLVVFSGDLTSIQGLLCDALETPPSGVTRTAMQIIPAASLSAGRSVLIVLAGCVGGTGHDTASAELVCGKGYASDKPTASLLVATMDRAPTPDRISVQAFGGSIAAGTLTLRYVSSDQFTSDLAYDVPPGAMSPKPPATNLSVQTLGSNPAEGRLNIYEKYQSTPTTYALLPDALARSGLTLADFVDGRNYTVVWLGARPGSSGGTWWAPFSVLVVPSDP